MSEEKNVVTEKLNDNVVVKEAEKPVEPKKNDFTTLTKGMHVRLACKCEGFIDTIHADDEDEESRWFSITHTIGSCGTKRYENIYGEGKEIKKSIFRTDLFRRVFPFEVVPAPTWFQSLEAGPRINNDYRYVILGTIVGDIQAIIPCAGGTNAFVLATTLREKFGPENVNVAVLENTDMETARKTAKVFLKEIRTVAAKNAVALADWILASIAMDRDPIVVAKCQLKELEIGPVLTQVMNHPSYNKQTVKVTSCEGKEMTLRVEKIAI